MSLSAITGEPYGVYKTFSYETEKEKEKAIAKAAKTVTNFYVCFLKSESRSEENINKLNKTRTNPK